MKQYQFKTINNYQFSKPITVPPKNTTPNNFYAESNFGSQQSQFTKTSTDNSNTNYSTENSSQSLLNLSNLKKQLDSLLKQTDYIENSKRNSVKVVNQSNYEGARSLSNGSKVGSREIPQRAERMKNYQKYQRSLEQTNFYKGNQSNANKIGSQTSIKGQYSRFSQNFNSFKDKNSSYSANYFPSPTTIKQPIKPVSSSPFYQNSYVSKAYMDENKYVNNTSPKVNNPQSYLNKNNFQFSNINSNNFTKETTKTKSYLPELELSNGYDKNKVAEVKTTNNYVNKQFKQINNQVKAVESYDVDSISIKMKLKEVEAQRDRLKQSLTKVEESKEYYRNELFEERKKSKKLQQDYQAKIQLSIKEKQAEITKINQNFNASLSQTQQLHQNQINKLNQQFKRVISDKQNQLGQVISKHLQTINSLESEIEKKNGKMVSLIKQINENQSTQNIQNNTEQIQGLFNTLAEKQHQVIQLHSELNSREQHIQMLNETFQELRNQIDQLKAFKNEVQKENLKDFDQILMNQIKTINELKDSIEQLNERLNQAKLTLIQSNRQNQSLQNEIKIIQFKHKSQISSLKIQKQIQISNMENTISSLNKKMFTMQQKMKLANVQIKKKDEFVKQYLAGRASFENSKQYIQEMFSKYQSNKSESKEQELLTKLQKAQKQLQLYQKYVS